MEGGGKDFSSLVALIEDVETKGVKPQAASVLDITATFLSASDGSGRKESYSELLQSIGGVIEPGRRQPREAVEVRPELQPHLITAGIAQTQFARAAPPPKRQEAVGAVPEQSPIKSLRIGGDKVFKELSALTIKLASMAPYVAELQRRRINTDELVMPGLSVADQISELERITEGVREDVFDLEHLQIVADEVYGLAQVVAVDRKHPKPGVQQTPLEKSLVGVRDQKINAAIVLLKEKGV